MQGNVICRVSIARINKSYQFMTLSVDVNIIYPSKMIQTNYIRYVGKSSICLMCHFPSAESPTVFVSDLLDLLLI